MAISREREQMLNALVARVLKNQVPLQLNIDAAKQVASFQALADERGGGALCTGTLATMYALIRASRTTSLLDEIEALTPFELQYFAPRCQPSGVEARLVRVSVAFEMAWVAMGG